MTAAERVEMAGDESSGTKPTQWMGAVRDRAPPSLGSPGHRMRAPWATTRRPAQAIRLPGANPHGRLARCLARTWRGAAAAALVAFSVLAGTSAPASAQEIMKFFDNTGGISHTFILANYDHKVGQPVRTGSHEDGYTLTEVCLRARGYQIENSSLTIRKHGMNGELVATLQYTSASSAAWSSLATVFVPTMDVAVYSAPPNTTLEPDTTYYISAAIPSGKYTMVFPVQTLFSWWRSGNEWNLPNGYAYRHERSSGRWSENGNGQVMRLAFVGYRNSNAPLINNTPRVSGSGVDGNWLVSDAVEVLVAFDDMVDVDTSAGTPSIGIDLGGSAAEARSAAYRSGSGTRELVFGYTLDADDGMHDSMAVRANSLVVNGGSIRDTETEEDAQLTHDGAVVQGRDTRSTTLRANFRNMPERHDGETAFTVGLRFSSAPTGLSAQRDAVSVLEVTGGRVTGAREPSEDTSTAWEVTVTPEHRNEVTITLPVRACGKSHAVCADGTPLSEAAEATVPGPLPSVSISAAAG